MHSFASHLLVTNKWSTFRDFRHAIKKLKRKKATGPDSIQNEAFIEANEETRKIYKEAMNKINKTAEIPPVWQKGQIQRLYKGKGIKGKCSNERGITLSSNFGKLYERIINERILEQINMTEAQAGGRRGSSTVDHIVLIKELIAAAKRQKKDAYIAYLDVAKAYDKAWLKAIMYVLYKEGLQDNHWTILKRLNENLTATLHTKFGLTREITIKDSIRQGGVPSTTMYGILMDEINKEIKKENLGIQIEGMTEKIGSLLWVDDVCAVETSKVNFQTELDITNNTSNIYHIEYGASKSNTQRINHTRNKEEMPIFKLGEMELKQADKYKYLGLIQNEKNNNVDHFKNTKGKVEAAYQQMLAAAGTADFYNIEMEVIWTVVEKCISPIITYAGEAWETKNINYKTANSILESIIKRILKKTQSTPREALYIETGLMDPETIVKKNRITMEARIKKGDNKTMTEIINLKHKDCWAEQNARLKKEFNIEEEDLIGTKYHLKNKLQREAKQILKKGLEKSAKDKSKMQYYLEGKKDWSIGNRASYLDKLPRNKASIIFIARTRMLKVRANYKNGNKDLSCRACKETTETQQHILEECSEIHGPLPKVTKEMIFKENTIELEKTAEIIQNIMDYLQKMEKHLSIAI